MKPVTIILGSAAVGLAAFGVAMATTNPSQAEYEEYATQRLTEYVKEDFCGKTTNFLENLIKSQCDNLVDQASPQIQQILSRSTEKQNFVIFTVYTTELQLSSLIPGYKFETLGALNKFYTYTAEKK